MHSICTSFVLVFVDHLNSSVCLDSSNQVYLRSEERLRESTTNIHRLETTCILQQVSAWIVHVVNVNVNSSNQWTTDLIVVYIVRAEARFHAFQIRFSSEMDSYLSFQGRLLPQHMPQWYCYNRRYIPAIQTIESSDRICIVSACQYSSTYVEWEKQRVVT
jgi:hypothetical protein